MRRLLVLVLVCGCSGGAKSSNAPSSRWQGPALLANVPADTPYVLAVLEPNEQFRKRMFAGMPERLAKLVDKAHDMPDQPWAPVVLEFEQIVQGKPPEQWPELLGLDPPMASHGVVYGLGLWPVARIGLHDPARLRSVIERLARAAHLPLQEHTLDGHAYWTTGSAKVTVIGAVLPHEAVFAVMPSEAVASALPLVLGTQPPRASLRDARDVPDVMGRYGFLGAMIAFVDTRRVVDAALAPAPRGIGEAAAALRTPACKTDIDRIVELAPRIVMGYRKLDDTGFSASLVLETSRAVAKALSRLRTNIPAVPLTGQAMFAMAAAVDVDATIVELHAIGNELRVHPFTCGPLRELDDMADKLIAIKPMEPIYHGLRGFGVVVEDLSISPPGGTGQLVAIGDKMPQIAAQMLQNIPGAKPVAADGVPVELSLHMIAPGMKSAYVALHGDRAVVTLGPNGEGRARDALAAPAAAHSPLFAMSYDLPRIRERLGAWFGDSDVGYDFGNAALIFDVREEGIVMDIVGTWAKNGR